MFMLLTWRVCDIRRSLQWNAYDSYREKLHQESISEKMDSGTRSAIRLAKDYK